MTQHSPQHPVLSQIESACRKQDIPEDVTRQIVSSARQILEQQDLMSPEQARLKALRAFMEEHHPELLASHAGMMTHFLNELANRPQSQWARLHLSAGFLYGFFGTRGCKDAVDQTEALIAQLDEAGLLVISYIYEDRDEFDEPGDGDWAEMEKEDLPAPGEPGYSPITGELDPDFHDKIIRHFEIGKPLLDINVA